MAFCVASIYSRYKTALQFPTFFNKTKINGLTMIQLLSSLFFKQSNKFPCNFNFPVSSKLTVSSTTIYTCAATCKIYERSNGKLWYVSDFYPRDKAQGRDKKSLVLQGKFATLLPFVVPRSIRVYTDASKKKEEDNSRETHTTSQDRISRVCAARSDLPSRHFRFYETCIFIHHSCL